MSKNEGDIKGCFRCEGPYNSITIIPFNEISKVGVYNYSDDDKSKYKEKFDYYYLIFLKNPGNREYCFNIKEFEDQYSEYLESLKPLQNIVNGSGFKTDNVLSECRPENSGCGRKIYGPGGN